ncbi:hypothetical protein METUNv1_03938 [Methyloversatilis universalis FAM5]|uniref:Uncharacterized protein n=1 Tax=Methyloversatilis universalis (strain ATCC BAA-1314 / DSM 25237 / JCM 13912 / CCUG 52030 / FAM5) TaxID=1000565 RepID=F5RHY8_METUF|nr:hypothetical protein METUNv1_03938 [Methyloversatilis universalis FAM5]
MTAPTLTPFAAPRGGCARPWGGPAGGAGYPFAGNRAPGLMNGPPCAPANILMEHRS